MTSVFRNPAAEFVYVRTYSRWLEDEGRRETWDETVSRYLEFLDAKSKNKIPKTVRAEIEEHIRSMSVMPSMRALWAAGPSLERNNLCGYNCSYTSIESLEDFSEILFILMCGVGAGFSVEKQYIEKLPAVKQQMGVTVGEYVIEDTKEGWADALLFGLKTWFSGQDVNFNFSKLRERGSRLLVSGGRSSGPEPLKNLISFARRTIIGDGMSTTAAQGRQLTSLECHDLCCAIADVVVCGGVRRSSLISYSDLNDPLMVSAKNPPYPPIRSMANNSVVFKSKPNSVDFLREWTNLAASGTGERGIYNLYNSMKQSPRRVPDEHFRGNPCQEIILKNKQLCNLSEVVIRSTDDFDDVIQKIKTAVWLGTFQSTLIKFKYLRPLWSKNCGFERLLGVSLTGQLDNPKLFTPDKLEILRKYAIKVNKQAAKIFNINQSVAITCGKPSGSVSQVVDAASGMHPRRSPFYIRRYRISSNDPLFLMLRDQGVKFSPENGQTVENATTMVVSFPIKAPKNSIFVADMSAIDQLKWYLKLQKHWCEHSQSCTIYVGDDEWASVGAFVYEHLDEIIGVSFLPRDNGVYKQAPEEEITEEQYKKMLDEFPKIDYSKLSLYETEDNTSGAQTLACTGNKCEI